MTLAEIIAIAAADPEFITSMSSNELWYGNSTNDRLTDVIAAIASAVQGKAEADHAHSGYAEANHAHTGYAPSQHEHSGYAQAEHTHTGYAAATHTHDGYAAATHTHTGYAPEGHSHSGYAASSHTHAPGDVTGLSEALNGKASSNHTHAQTDVTGLAEALNGKAATNHTHDYAASGHTHTPESIGAAASNHSHSGYAASNHTHSGNVIVEQAGSPYVRLKLTEGACESRIYKNAGATADYGLTLADYDADGARDSLIFCRGNALDKKLYLNVQNDDDTRSLYYLYGEHHKPTLEEIGGGTISGDVNVNGVLRVNGQQSFYFQTSTNSQTVGTNNATGGTTICCGASADVGVNGANMKAPNVLPRSNNAFALGSTNLRWKGIYSTAAVNVSSDKRLKRNISKLDKEALASFIEKLGVVRYNYKDDAADAKARIGLVAQDVQKADAELAKFFVSEDEDGMLGLAAADLVFPLIAAVQQLSKRVAELEAKI